MPKNNQLDEDGLRKLIREEIETAVKDRFRPILTKLDSIQNSLDLQTSNMDEDRKDFAEIKTSQATVDRLMRETLDIVSNQTKRITDKVSEKADESIQVASQVMAEVVENKVEESAAKVVNKIKNGKLKKPSLFNKLMFWKK